MEIYTNDLLDIAVKYSSKISNNIGYSGYVIQDECCNLHSEIRNILYKRLSEAFENFIENDFDEIESKEDLRKTLFKIINEL